jgi:oligopeptide/dipeptide ABC transporter ATP-binding protein
VVSTVLDVRNLRTHFFLDEGVLKSVDDVSFRIEEKKTLGLIGESGCGKSVTAQSILRIVPRPGRCVSGSILLRQADGTQVDLVPLSPKGSEIRRIRGKDVAMIFQEPMSSLSPVYTVGNQIVEALTLHVTKEEKQARAMAMDLLDKVGISNPRQRFDDYPHQLSGGLRQRVMIAMALSCNPSLLIADEPTTALDVTVQAQILELLQELQQQYGMAILFITHDLGVIAELADMTAVMYLGRIVEYAPTREIFSHPLHPYTAGLLRSTLSIKGVSRERLTTIPGIVPMAIDRPPECGFRTRCARIEEGKCIEALPRLVEVENGHFVRCFLHSGEREG